MNGYKPRYRRKSVKSRKLYTRRPKVGRRTFSKKVRKVVTSMAEKKQTISTSINQSLTTGDNTILVPNIALAPPLSQGAAENARIGNKVKVTYANISGYINMLPYNATTNTFPNLNVRMFLVSLKNRNTTNNLAGTLTTSDFDTFLEQGSSGIPFQGNMVDIIAPVNTERWTVHAQRTIHLSLGGTSSAYTNSTSPQEGSSSYQARFSFNFTKALGILNYDDSFGSVYPTNKNCYLVIQPITSDGSSRQAGPIAEVHYKYDVKYIDL